MSTRSDSYNGEIKLNRAASFDILACIMTPRCVAKLRPMKQRAELFGGD